MLIPEDNRELKDVPVRELLAGVTTEQALDILLSTLEAAFRHCVQDEKHDYIVKALAVKLDDILQHDLSEEERECGLVVVEALHIAMMEYITRLMAAGDINDMLNDKKN